MSSPKDVTVPDIGDFEDVPVIEILVKPGERVTKDAPLVVLESEKAILEVPCPDSGTVVEIKVAIGDRVSVGALLLTLDVRSDEDRTEPPVSYPTPATQVVTDAAAKLNSPVAPLAAERSSPILLPGSGYASPSVRRFARELGIDISAVEGNGPRRRVLRQDLLKFAKESVSAPQPRADRHTLGGFEIAPWPRVDFARFGRIERVPLSRIRKISGTNLARNAMIIPHVTNFEDADVTDLEDFRRLRNSEIEKSEHKLTLLPFLIKAAAATLARHIEFNSSLDGDEVVLKRYFHIGMAVDTPNGLVVPVIRDVDLKGISQIATEAATLAGQARDGKLRAEDMLGGSFTISSLGGIGGTGFTPIVNAPEVAILGATRAQMRPVWNGAEFRPRLILPLALSWDHRVVDGAAAARFLVNMAQLLGDFRRVLL